MLNSQQESLRGDESALRRELEAIGTKFRGRSCLCPFHQERNPSAGIYCHNGVWKFKCHGCQVGGDIFDIRSHLNKTTVAEELAKVGDLAPRSPAPPPQQQTRIFPDVESIAAIFPNVQGVYRYTNPATKEVDLAVIRFVGKEGKKKFVQVSKTAGGYCMKAPPGPLPIYNRIRVATSQQVVVVEGEKCVHALQSLGVVATTSPGGALKGDMADWTPLAGKTVILWPDNDAPDEKDTFYPTPKGVEHMRRVQKILLTLDPPPQVYWFDPAPLELPVKGDVADLVERLRESKQLTEDDIRAMIDTILADAEPVGYAGDYLKEMEATIAGQRRSIPFAWRTLTKAARALMPGKVTCIFSDGGSGKSLFISNILVDWYQSIGIKACIYHLEDDRNYHLRRMHAQLASDARITDNEWVEANGDLARQSSRDHRQALEELGRRVWEAPEELVSLEMLAAWMEERAKAGYEVIIIDPITAAESTDKPWIADLKFITQAKLIGRRYGTRIILVTHPKGGGNGRRAVNHNDMAGGAAYPRFAHTVLLLQRNDAEEEYPVRRSMHCVELIRPTHIVSISKARNGPGSGKKIAFNFDSAKLLFEELGLIERSES